MKRILFLSLCVIFYSFFVQAFLPKAFACISSGSNGCTIGSTDTNEQCCSKSALCETTSSEGILGSCVDTGITLPPHDGYGNDGQCSGKTSICYTGNSDNATAGQQCGTLSNWQYQSSGGTKVDVCGGGVCCGPNNGTNNITSIPPNLCPSQNGVCTNIDTALGPIDVKGPGQFIQTVFAVLLSFSGGTAMLLIIFSGYRIMAAQGDPEKVKGAREMLTSAIIGLLFVIFSVTILQVLGVSILHIPGFQ